MAAMWDAFFWLIPIWVFVFIPFSTFYYEADDGMLMAGTAYAPNAIKKSRFGQALCYQMFVFIFVGIFFAVTYVVLSDTSIPVTEIRGGKISQAINDGIGVYTIDRRTNSTGSVLPFEKSLLTEMGDTDIFYLGQSLRIEAPSRSPTTSRAPTNAPMSSGHASNGLLPFMTLLVGASVAMAQL
jgi:LMBR1 domain-containing protein 1